MPIDISIHSNCVLNIDVFFQFVLNQKEREMPEENVKRRTGVSFDLLFTTNIYLSQKKKATFMAE